MATRVTVELPGRVYKQAEQFARLHNQDMETLISEIVQEGIEAREAKKDFVDWTEPDPAVDREREAYVAMHPKLREDYFGKYVAVYHGELVDHDNDFGTLAERIDEKYPGEFVWMTQVGPEPIRTIRVRSPRVVRE